MTRIYVFNIFCAAALVLVVSSGCSKLAENTTALDGNKCLVCHTLPPAGLFHAIHPADKITCGVCHDGYDYADDRFTPPPYHRQDTIVKFSSFDALSDSGATFNADSQSCKAVYCHGNFLDGQHRTVSVNDRNTIGCAFCHDTTTMFALGHPRTDTLTWHRHRSKATLRNCSNCHEGYSIINRTVVDSIHQNNAFDVFVTNPQDSIVRVTPDSNGAVDNSVCSKCH